ncbi:MAG: anaerobic ribonucleoside-triphosphate reductase activating protein [Atopobiaceae bacterium]|jgi:anaerobic ribonucleoside-triphosphate reductase activating protein|nr:anaerobic ribonucleoside-triphosphate reductase activating protein [Atopobiaceae bacterium]MCI2173122.1 anaerobic ribonucleoside-triphosphate reductase activating protein [Atopobiaceae bacterium]MCI2208215.1 anaerobic ribonucleoside-triphosphate reductase activating protein [Atopobiaceae bacterium]
MNYANIKYCDIANGVGVRTSLFVSGCRRHCKDCFNEVAWPFDFGEPFDADVADKIVSSLAPSYVAGLSILGGEPMEPENQRGLVGFLEDVRVRCPSKGIWLYTGDTYEDLLREGAPHRTEVTDRLLSCLDVLVDGEFVAAEKDISLRFKGSGNQRVIDMEATRSEGHVVCWHDEKVFSTHTMDA